MTKNLKITLIIFSILIGIYFITQQSQSQYTSKSNKLFSITENDLKKIVIKNYNSIIELSLQDSIWNISDNDTLIVKQQSIDNFIDKVLMVEIGTLVSKNGQKWSKYSVDDSTGNHLKLIDAEGNIIDYAVFGRSKSDYSRNYVRTHENPQVFLTNSNILYYLSTSLEYWGEVPTEKLEELPLENIIKEE